MSWITSGWRDVFWTAAIYSALVLAFTGLSLQFAPSSATVGGLRAADTIAPHLAELVGFGILLGLLSIAAYGAKGSYLVILSPLLVVLLDLDHLPAYLGVPQVIRPAHSLVFLLAVLVITGITLRRMEIELILLSSFTAHVGIDTGIFPLLAPFSYQYYYLMQFRIVAISIAIVSALAAGFVIRTRGRGKR
ncbi:MAG TPA: hypothetical protein VFE91_07865 [Nitrososphaerales archaeon]|nr:hypothetical protein [Nitrososphaerales archaeon]